MAAWRQAVVRDVGGAGHPYGFVDRMPSDSFELASLWTRRLSRKRNCVGCMRMTRKCGRCSIWAQTGGTGAQCRETRCGVVIAPTRLTDYSPLYCEQDDPSVVTQFDKDDVEARTGQVRLPGLRTLTIIDWRCRRLTPSVSAGRAGAGYCRYSLNDSLTFELLKRYETTAVFQLESADEGFDSSPATGLLKRSWRWWPCSGRPTAIGMWTISLTASMAAPALSTRIRRWSDSQTDLRRHPLSEQ